MLRITSTSDARTHAIAVLEEARQDEISLFLSWNVAPLASYPITHSERA